MFVSVVYLAIQVRESTRATRSSTYQSIIAEFGAINTAMTSTPDLSSLFVAGLEDFNARTADERAKLSQLFFLVFRNFENMYYQHRRGHLENEVWIGWQRLMLTYFHGPGFQQWWAARRPVFSEGFARFLETEAIDVPIPSYYDLTRDLQPVTRPPS